MGGGDIPTPTPVSSDGLVVITSSHGPGRPIYAIRTDAAGDITENRLPLVWVQERAGNYIPTPLLHDGLAYFCNDGGVMTVYRLANGERVYQQRLGNGGSGFSGSPVAAGGRLYATDEDGRTYVLALGLEYRLLAENELGENVMCVGRAGGWGTVHPWAASPVRHRLEIARNEGGGNATIAPEPASRYPLVMLRYSFILLLCTGAVAADWPQWRGPNRDGISPETGLLQAWPGGGPKQVWKARGLGEGYSSFAVVGNRLYTQGQQGNQEFVLAIDVATGKPVWKTPTGNRVDNERGNGPRGTPTVDGKRLYVVGADGTLACLETETGKRVWSVSFVRNFGGRSPKWAFSESPLVEGDTLVVVPGGPGAAIVALNKNTGAVAWKTQSDSPGYSSPGAVRCRRGARAGCAHGGVGGGGEREKRRAAVAVSQGIEQGGEHRHADCEPGPRVRLDRLRHGLRAPQAQGSRRVGERRPRCTSIERCATTTPRRCWWGTLSTASPARS